MSGGLPRRKGAYCPATRIRRGGGIPNKTEI